MPRILQTYNSPKAEVIAQPNLIVSPESLHFGLMDKQSKTEDLFLANTGTSDLKYEIYLSDKADSPKADMALWATGYNRYGQLGDGSTSNKDKPVEVLPKGIKQISTDKYHTLVLKDDGSTWAMGYNHHGQLGDGSTTNRKSPVRIFESGVKKVEAGFCHSIILKNDGSVWTTGSNIYGQLGDGTNTSQKTPIKVFSSGVVDISAGITII